MIREILKAAGVSIGGPVGPSNNAGDNTSEMLPPNLGSPGTHVYVFDEVALKVVEDPASPRMLREADSLQHLSLHGCRRISTPRLLKTGITEGGQRWVLMSRLAGTPPADAARPAHELSTSLATQLGTAAAALHSAPTPPGFGTWSRDPGITLIDEHRQRCQPAMVNARASRLLTRSEVDVLERLLSSTMNSLRSAPSRPVLAHRDLQPRNVLVGSDGILTGVVDFEAAGGGDPAEDFSRLALDWTTPSFRAFCDAYKQSGASLGVDTSERITFHTLYWAALIIGRVALHFPGYLEPARLAIKRAAEGERPAY